MGETMMDPKVFPLYVWGSFPLQQLFTGESAKARPRQNEGNDGDAVRHQDKTGILLNGCSWFQYRNRKARRSSVAGLSEFDPQPELSGGWVFIVPRTRPRNLALLIHEVENKLRCTSRTTF